MHCIAPGEKMIQIRTVNVRKPNARKWENAKIRTLKVFRFRKLTVQCIFFAKALSCRVFFLMNCNFFPISGSDFLCVVGPSHLDTKPCIGLLGLTWRGLMLSDVKACSVFLSWFAED